MRRILLYCFLLSTFPLISQVSTLDSLKVLLVQIDDQAEVIDLHHQMFSASLQYLPDSAVVYARKALALSETYGDPELHNRSFYNLSHAFKASYQPDSMKKYLQLQLQFLEDNRMEAETAKVYRNLAVHGEVTREPDSSLYYIDKCLEVLAQFPDSVVMGQAYLSQGFSRRVKGYYNLAIPSFLKALEILEQNEDPNPAGYTYQNIGITYAMNEREEKAIEMSEKACEFFARAGNDRALAQTKNNIGYMNLSLKRYAESIPALNDALQYSMKTNQHWVTNNIHWNLTRAYFELGEYDKTLNHLDSVSKYTEIIDDEFMRGAILRWKAKVALKQNKPLLARQWTEASLSFVRDYNDPSLDLEMQSELSELYEGLGNAPLALDYWKKANVLEDSLFTLKKDRQIEELSVQYETAKKDAEIAQLNARQEIVSSRNKLLWIGLLSAIIAAASIIYALLQRRKKEKILHQKEQEVAKEKRRAVEQQLEQKKRELTASVLQVAKKNEFLHHLESEVQALHSTVDQKINTASKKISRLINRSTNDQEDWDQFAKEFTSVHSTFLKILKDTHGEFSKSEMRLIALMKMNLSSKDIANLLNISDEGVKKARYRLRKKLGLESDVEIQTYLINLG